MQYKYRVEILDIETCEVKECWDYRTKQDISETYKIPMYIIDKLIKKTNDSTYTTKRNPHMVYKELMNSMRIEINRPKL
jgi:hypothetical protein